MLRFFMLSFFVAVISFRLFSQNLIDVTLVDNGKSPDITMDKEGNIHMSFGNNSGIFYQSFNSKGVSLRVPKLIVSRGSSYSNLSLSSSSLALINGRVMTLWTDQHLMTFNAYIHGRLYDTRNDSLYGIVPINSSYGDAIRTNPTIAALNDTEFVAIWTGNGCETPVGFGIYGNIFSSKYERSAEDIFISDIQDYKVNAGNAKVIIKPDGSGFRVFWRDNRTGADKVYAREFFKDGAPNGNSFLVSEDPKIKELWFLDAAADKNGSITVVWGAEMETPDWQIQLRRLDKHGKPLGASEYVTSRTGGTGEYPTVSVAIDSSGNSAVAWDQKENNGNIKIYAQRFSAENKPIGQVFRVSMANDNLNQYDPILKISAGNIYCFWSESHDTTDKVKLSILNFNNPVLSAEDSEEQAAAYDFRLLQNYPNPFNPTTTISYSIKNDGHVKLSIFDLLGNLVKTITDEYKPAGNYSARFDGGNLPSGIYFYRLESNGHTAAKKFMLVK